MLSNQTKITPTTSPATANQLEQLLAAFETQRHAFESQQQECQEMRHAFEQQIQRMEKMLLSLNDMFLRALSKNHGGVGIGEKGAGSSRNDPSFLDTFPGSLDNNDGVLTDNIGGSTNNVASHIPQSTDDLLGAPPQTTDPPHQSLLPGPNAEPLTNIDYRLLVIIIQPQ